MNKKNKKSQIEFETIVYWIIAIVVLILVIVGIMYSRNQGNSAIDFIKGIFRFGRS